MADYGDNIDTSIYIYKRPVYVTEPTGERQTFIPLKLNLHQDNFNFDTALPDGLDFRLSESDNGTGVLQMWIAYWNDTQRKATLWFKLPELLANETMTLFAFWGYEHDGGDSDLRYLLGEATTVSGEESTPVFLFGDDFEGSELDVNKWPSSNGSYTISDSKINLGTGSWIRTGSVLGGQDAQYAGVEYKIPLSTGLYGNHNHTGNCYLGYNGGLGWTQSEFVDGDVTSYNDRSVVSHFGGCAIGVDIGEIRGNISKVRVYMYDKSETNESTAYWNTDTWWVMYKSDTNINGEQTHVYTFSASEITLVKYQANVWYFDLNLDAPGEETRYIHLYGYDNVHPALNRRYSEIEVYSDESTTYTQPGKFMVEDGIEGVGSPSSTTSTAHKYRFYGGDNHLGINYFWEGSTNRQHDAVDADVYVTYNEQNTGLVIGEYAQTYIGYHESTDRVYQGMENRSGDFVPTYSDDLCVDGEAKHSITDAGYEFGYVSADLAFDDDEETVWSARAGESGWIGYNFTDYVQIEKIVINMANITYFELQGSNDSDFDWDDKSWDTIYVYSGGSGVTDTHYFTFDNSESYVYMRLYLPDSGTINEPRIYEIDMMAIVSYDSELDYAESWERQVHRNTEVSNFRIFGEDDSSAEGVEIDWVIARDFTPESDPIINYNYLYVEYEIVYHQTVDYSEYQDDVTSVDFYHTSDMGGDPYRMSDNVTNSISNIFISDTEVTEGNIVIDFGRTKYNITDNNYDHFSSDNTVEYYNAAKLSDLDTDVHGRDYWQTTTTSGWACIEFPTTENISSLSFIAVTGSADRMPNNFRFYGSQSNPRYSGWYDKVLIYEGVSREAEEEQVFYFNTGLTYYKYYILEVLDTHGGNVAIQEWAMFPQTDETGKKVISQLRLHPVAFEGNEYFFVKEVELYGSNNGYEWDLLLNRIPTATPFVDYMYGRWGRYTFDNVAGYYLYKLSCYDNWRAETDQIKIAEWEMVERVEELDSYRILEGTTDKMNNIWADPATNIDDGTIYITNDVFNTVENEKLANYTTLSGGVDDFNVKL